MCKSNDLCPQPAGLTLSQLFENDSVNFIDMMATGRPEQPSSLCIDMQEVLKLNIHTISGAEHCINTLRRDSTIGELKASLAEKLNVPVFTLALISETRQLDGDDTMVLRHIESADLKTSLVVVRRQGKRQEWQLLFSKLVQAIRARREDVATLLVNQGAGFDGHGNMLHACQDMQRPGDFTAEEGQLGSNMLHLAIREGLAGLALHLINHSVDIDASSDVGRTPLQQAVLRKMDDVACALLDLSADASVRDYLDNTALTYALRAGNDALSSRLLSLCCPEEQEQAFVGLAISFQGKEVIVRSCDSLCQRRAHTVFQSCADGMPLSAIALLKSGAPITGVDHCGRTALHYAYARGMRDVVSALLAHGADINAKDKFGMLPKDGVPTAPSVN